MTGLSWYSPLKRLVGRIIQNMKTHKAEFLLMVGSVLIPLAFTLLVASVEVIEHPAISQILFISAPCLFFMGMCAWWQSWQEVTKEERKNERKHR